MGRKFPAVSLRFKPQTEPSIVNLRPLLPERWLQGAKNPQVIQFQFHDLDMTRKKLANVPSPNMQTQNSGFSTLRENYHDSPR